MSEEKKGFPKIKLAAEVANVWSDLYERCEDMIHADSKSVEDYEKQLADVQFDDPGGYKVVYLRKQIEQAKIHMEAAASVCEFISATNVGDLVDD